MKGNTQGHSITKQNGNIAHLVNTYLYYGYLPPVATPNSLDQLPTPIPLSFTVGGAAQLFEQVMGDALKRYSTWPDRCIVPLSGGWDSRILFGAALQRFPTDRIVTISFGAPGQLDYEIGAQIAQRYGVSHSAVDLSRQKISWDALRKSVSAAPWTYTLDAYFNRLAVSTATPIGSDIVLSGFMGDPLTGGHYSEQKSFEAAKETFVKKQRKVKGKWLPAPDYLPSSSLPLLSESSPFSPSEQFDIYLRQSTCIAPIVTPCSCWQSWTPDIGKLSPSGAKVITPFTHPEWASYWLHAPASAKHHQRLYLGMMDHLYPELASLPSKYSLGVPQDSRLRMRIARSKRNLLRHLEKRLPRLEIKDRSGLNYLDYDHAFRAKDDYREVLDKAIKLLKKNDIAPWLDYEAMLREHINYRTDNANAFQLLIGLALNLEREGIIAS